MTEPPPDDRHWLRRAIELSRRSPPAPLFCVGALLVDKAGSVLGSGFSRQHGPHDHAEEVALASVGPGDPRVRAATLYSSLEPCSTRASRPLSCTELILAAGIRRVVFAWREPDVFVDCEGAEILARAGVEVVELDELAPDVRQINSHLL